MKRISRRALVLLSATVVAVAASVGAYAYWTTTGTGNGTATVGTDGDNLFVTGSVVDPAGTGYVTQLTPGGDPVEITFTVANPSDFNQSVSEIQLVSVDACSLPWDYTNPLAPTCDGGAPFVGDLACDSANSGTDDFQMADVTVDPATDGDIAPLATAQALTATGDLYMNNLESNQDACKNANLHLVLTSS